MSLILSIDTSLEVASVSLSNDSGIIALETNSSQMDHAAWIHTAIRSLFTKSDNTIQHLEAVAVTSGPGSYTGLRVGMATAQGLCYALNIPLITETTLKLTAMRMRAEYSMNKEAVPLLFCPMIDARRNEVFTALYDTTLQLVMEPSAVILNEYSFAAELERHQIVFGGNGAGKWETMTNHPNAVFTQALHKPADLTEVAQEKLKKGLIADLAYTEPDYFKNVYTGK